MRPDALFLCKTYTERHYLVMAQTIKQAIDKVENRTGEEVLDAKQVANLPVNTSFLED